MRLGDSHLRKFLPAWAADVGFLCDGMDGLLGAFNERAISLSAPLTLEACQALTDEEIQKYYEEFGLAKYYPDISHERRAWLLWQQTKLWRWLGTPRAVEILCEYIMDLTPVTLKITDDLAFGPNGELRNPELLHVFDAELSVEAADLPEYALSRVYANIVRFKNDRTVLRGFSFIFEMSGKGLYAEACVNDGGEYERFYDITTFDDTPKLYKKTVYFHWQQSQVQINAGATMSVSPLMAYNALFEYTPTRYYSGWADIRGAAPTGLSLVNNNGALALYNGSGSAIRIQRLDFTYEPRT